MSRKLLMISWVLACSLILVSGSAWATCQDLEGTWNAEVWAGGAAGTQHWEQCTGLTIAPGGNITPGGTYTDALGDTLNITGGELSVNTECEIAGTIETSDGTISVERGSIGENGLFFDKVAP